MADGLPGSASTEAPNPSAADLDLLDSAELLRVINDEDRRAAWAVERELGDIARAVDAVTERLSRGGRLHYFGAGTSGRIGVMDAAELPPTFSVPLGLVVAHIAGGDRAVRESVEAAEDDEQAGRMEAGQSVSPVDSVIGISASGSAAYVIGALRAARAKGALTVALTNNARTQVSEIADLTIALLTGPEIIAGSTRMKAASAQKMALNMISTAVMIKLGKAYRNLMVDLAPASKKLRARAERLTKQLTNADDAVVRQALEACGYRVKIAVVMLRSSCNAQAAERLLSEAGGSLRNVLS